MAEWTAEDEVKFQQLQARRNQAEQERFEQVFKIVDNVYYHNVGSHDLTRELTIHADELVMALLPYANPERLRSLNAVGPLVAAGRALLDAIQRHTKVSGGHGPWLNPSDLSDELKGLFSAISKALPPQEGG